MAILDFLFGKPPGPTKGQQAITSMQKQAAQTAMPYYSPILQWMAQQAGLQMPPGIAGPMATTQPVGRTAGFGARPTGTMAPNQMALASIQPAGGRVPMTAAGQPQQVGLPNSALGIYGQNPADVFRMQQAEEDVDRFTNRGAASMMSRFARQGIGDSATAAAAQARLAQAGQKQLGDFRRNLAIQSGQEQERRMQQLLAALGMGVGQGAQAQQQMGAQQQLAAQQQGQNMQQLMSLLPFFF